MVFYKDTNLDLMISYNDRQNIHIHKMVLEIYIVHVSFQYFSVITHIKKL